jgi:hypothetical protein
VVAHEHALVKVKLPHQVVKKEDLIQKYRNEIFVNKHLPPGHYIPSLSKSEAEYFVNSSKKMMNDTYEGTQRMMNDMFHKLLMSHQNPYELVPKAPSVPPKKETMAEKIDYLESFGVERNQANKFCSRYPHSTKE